MDGYDYELPPDRIAQNPVVPRDSSRLLAVDSPSSQQHRIFRDLPDLLEPGDLLVLNNTRVLPARLYGHKPNGQAVEILLMEEREHNCWLALVKPGKRLKLGAKIEFDPIAPHCDEEAAGPCCCIPQGAVATLTEHLTATVVARDDATGGRLLEFNLPTEMSLIPFLDEYGTYPYRPTLTIPKLRRNSTRLFMPIDSGRSQPPLLAYTSPKTCSAACSSGESKQLLSPSTSG